MTDSPGQPPPSDPIPQPEAPAAPPAAPASQFDVTPSPPDVAYPNYPLQLDVGYQQEYSRFMPLIKWLLVLPHFFVLFVLMIGAYFAIIGAFFVVLFTRRYPQGIFNYIVGIARWVTRVNAYTSLLTDAYPPFSLADDPNHPVRYNLDYPPDGQIARWRPFFAWVPVIPQFIMAYFLMIAGGVLVFIAFFAILFTKRFPRGMFDFVVNVHRFQARVGAYGLWLTERYPGFTLG